MMEIVGECTRNNLCVDCDNTECARAGDIAQDCPKYHCDDPIGDCSKCEFMKKYQAEMRAHYQREKEKDGRTN